MIDFIQWDVIPTVLFMFAVLYILRWLWNNAIADLLFKIEFNRRYPKQ